MNTNIDDLMNNDPKLKRLLMKPLLKRSNKLIGLNHQIEALQSLYNYVCNEKKFQDNFPEIERDLKSIKSFNSFANIDDVKIRISNCMMIYHANRMKEIEYIFYCSLVLENYFSQVWESDYKSQISDIEIRMEEVRKQSGLNAGEDWLFGEEPNEYKRLKKEYDRIYDEKYIDMLREVGLDDIADLKINQPKLLEKQRERGRRTFFHKKNKKEALRELILNYEVEAFKSAESGAFLSAIISFAAALEGLLILRCCRSPKKSAVISKKLDKKYKTKSHKDSDPCTWKFEALINVCFQAKWLKDIDRGTWVISSEKIAEYLRKMRNYVHPARHLKEAPWEIIGKKDFDFIKNFYIVLLSSLGESRKLSDTSPSIENSLE